MEKNKVNGMKKRVLIVALLYFNLFSGTVLAKEPENINQITEDNTAIEILESEQESSSGDSGEYAQETLNEKGQNFLLEEDPSGNAEKDRVEEKSELVLSEETDKEKNAENENQTEENQTREESQVPVSETKITLPEEKLMVSVLETEYMISTETENVDPKEMTLNWESSDPGIVSVESDGENSTVGKVTAHQQGVAVITVSVTDGNGSQIAKDELKVLTEGLLNGVHKDPTGMSDAFFYYQDGIIQKDITDVKKIDGKWYNLVQGRVQGDTVAKNKSGWWRIDSNGQVDFSYTGFAENENGWWYIWEGKVQFDVTDVIEGVVKEEQAWWNVCGGKVTFVDTVAENANGWWHIQNGKVNFESTTVAGNDLGWWYIRNGKVQFGYTGFAENENGWWYIWKGKVQFGVTDVIEGIVNGEQAWWNVFEGKVAFVDTVAKNANGWWRIENGKVNFSSNTVAQNSNGWWYIRKGKVDFNYTGIAENANGWWRIEKGKVNFKYTGIAQNANGYWYLTGGKVNFGYTGTINWDGQKYKVYKGKASIVANDYAMFNKAQSMVSNTQWLILVDTKKNRVGIYQGSKGMWQEKKYWKCTSGKASTPTVKGAYTVKSKGLKFGSGYTCWYYTQFYGNYLFHSILYNPGSKTSIQDGRLGINASHGCVRLSLENAKWIYDNIPKGTKVYIY